MHRWLAWVSALAATACSFSVPAASVVREDARDDAEPTGCAAANWRDGAWRSRYPLAVERSRVTGSAPVLPVLVALTSGELVRAKPGGEDLVFTAGDGTTLLPYEIEGFDVTTGALRAWVRLTVSNTADTPIFLYFDNPAATKPDVPDVWPDYLAVWHFNEDPGSVQGQARDSTINQNHATAQNMVSGDRVPGKIGTAFRFDGINNGMMLTPFIHPAQFMIEAWIRPTAITSYHTIVDTAANTRWLGLYNHQGSTGVEYWDGFDHMTNKVITLNAWHHVAVTYIGTTLRMFYDGVEIGTPVTLSLPAQMSSFHVGFSVRGEYFSGSIDELRVRTSARSAAEIATTYANQSAPDLFVKPGPLESCR
ncbi:MAG: DUF2341 domain-containing protein [Deltaproteobacteria bacterium]|nr:DUF2341 domain-containing protein [Deltaproteobacteria bacterium]